MKNSYFYSLFFVILGVVFCFVNISRFGTEKEKEIKPASIPVKEVKPFHEPIKIPLQPEPIVSDSIPSDSIRIDNNENVKRMDFRFMKKTFQLHKKPLVT